MRWGVPDPQRGGTGGAKPPRWVKGLVCSAYCHSDSENLIDYRESDVGSAVVITMAFGVMVIDMLFHVAVTLGTMMIDVLLYYSFLVMTPLVVTIPVAVPAVMAILVTILPAMLVAVPVWIPFALVPPVMMSMVRLVAVVIALAIIVVLAVSATVCPCVASQSQYKSNQNDACQNELPCHCNLLSVGLKPDPCGLFNPYDGDAAWMVYIELLTISVEYFRSRESFSVTQVSWIRGSMLPVNDFLGVV
jgi:hypothetical protein